MKSQKIDQIQVGQDTTTPGVSASPDPAEPVSQPAPAEGAASGAPQDPEPDDSPTEEWEEGEEEAAGVEDPVVEVAEESQRENGPPAVVLRGRSVVREARPPRTSLTDRPVVLRPAAHLSQQYLPGRGWPGHRCKRRGPSLIPVQGDLHTWGTDPHSHADEPWRDPHSISSIHMHTRPLHCSRLQ